MSTYSSEDTTDENKAAQEKKRALEMQDKANVHQSQALRLQEQAYDEEVQAYKAETASLKAGRRDEEAGEAKDAFKKVNEMQLKAFTAQRRAIQDTAEVYTERRKALEGKSHKKSSKSE